MPLAPLRFQTALGMIVRFLSAPDPKNPLFCHSRAKPSQSGSGPKPNLLRQIREESGGAGENRTRE